MGKLLNSGITWSDVTYLIEGLQNIHECTVELTVLTRSQTGAHTLDFTILAWIPSVEAQETKTIAEVKGSWPDKSHPTFDSCIFNACYDLDRAIGRAWMQEEIPK
jgi:hypothetical protein